jgi:hypothetical protein
MTSRNDLLGELAADAALERTDFVVRATEQLQRFLDSNADRIAEIGGMVLIDEDPDYLSVAPDVTFRSRTRYLDEATGEWVSDTEVIESAAELVELYNPADLYMAFAEAAREAAGLAPQPTATDELMGAAGVAPDETMRPDGGDIYAAAADQWAAGQPGGRDVDDERSAAQALYDLSLAFQERSQQTEARLLEQFSEQASGYSRLVGDLVVVDDDDERLTLESNGGFRAEVLPEEAQEWRTLTSSDELVEFYDPTDVFGDLADALAEAYPGVAPEMEEQAGGDDGEPAEDGPEGEGEGDGTGGPAH